MLVISLKMGGLKKAGWPLVHVSRERFGEKKHKKKQKESFFFRFKKTPLRDSYGACGGKTMHFSFVYVCKVDVAMIEANLLRVAIIRRLMVTWLYSYLLYLNLKSWWVSFLYSLSPRVIGFLRKNPVLARGNTL